MTLEGAEAGVPVGDRFAGMGGHHSARPQTDEWLTPRSMLDALGPFDLDPCSPVDRPWDSAAQHFTIADDGLRQPWHGFVWLNPPYGRQTWKWLQRLREHGQGIALVFARTETTGFFRQVWEGADALLFLRGRIDFHRVDGSTLRNAGAPSVLIGYGQQARARLLACGLPGVLIEEWSVTGGHETLFGEAVR